MKVIMLRFQKFFEQIYFDFYFRNKFLNTKMDLILFEVVFLKYNIAMQHSLWYTSLLIASLEVGYFLNLGLSLRSRELEYQTLCIARSLRSRRFRDQFILRGVSLRSMQLATYSLNMMVLASLEVID